LRRIWRKEALMVSLHVLQQYLSKPKVANIDFSTTTMTSPPLPSLHPLKQHHAERKKSRRTTAKSETVDMAGEEPLVDIEIVEGDDNGFPFQGEPLEDAPARVTFIDYLKSPAISLLVGQGDEQALLTAHQALLVTSPWFEEACARFSNDVSVRFYVFSASRLWVWRYGAE
jgi:hypothetical protein